LFTGWLTPVSLIRDFARASDSLGASQLDVTDSFLVELPY